MNQQHTWSQNAQITQKSQKTAEVCWRSTLVERDDSNAWLRGCWPPSR